MARSSVLGIRTIRRRLTRFVLTAVGIALGIGVFFAVLVTNASIDAAMDRVIGRRLVPNVRMEAAAGYAAELPADVVDRAAKLPGVIDVSGWTETNLQIPGNTDPEDRVYVYGGLYRQGREPAPRQPERGTDMVSEGRSPAEGADEIGLTDRLRRELGVSRGDSVELLGPTGAARLVVVETNQRRDGRPSDNRSAWTSFTTVRRLAGQPAGFIGGGNIRLGKTVDASDWIARHADELREVRLVSATVDEATLRDTFAGPKEALAGLAAVALFVCGFLIFLTLSMSVAESAAIHGTLRAIGASRAQVRRVVLTDAVILTLLSAPVGIALGLAAAVGMISLTRGIFDLPGLPITVSPLAALAALLVGVVVTFVSALVPAQRAASVAPAVAIREAAAEQRGRRFVPVLGLVVLLSGLASIVIAPQFLDVGSVFVLIGAVMAVPAVMPLLNRAAGAATSRMARGVGTVGVLHLRKEPRRTAYTVALVMTVLAMVFTAGAVHLSLRRNLITTLANRFPADLAISAGGRFDDALREQIAATPGVRATTDLRFTRTALGSGFAFITVLDPATFFDVQSIPWIDGSDGEARAAFRRGGGIAIPASVALATDLGRGDRITLQTPRGPRAFDVIGVYRTFDTQSPMLAGLADAEVLLGGTSPPGLMAVAVEPGTSPAAVKAAIERRFDDASPVSVQLTGAQRADFIEGQTAFFNIVYAFVLIAVVMGMLGVTNTLAMAVLRRQREIGILRAVGTERRLLRRMGTVEAATIALAGLVLAVPVGLLLSVTVLRAVSDAIGIVVQYVFPWPMFAAMSVLAVAVAVLSAIIPGRHAARVEPARVLRFD